MYYDVLCDVICVVIARSLGLWLPKSLGSLLRPWNSAKIPGLRTALSTATVALSEASHGTRRKHGAKTMFPHPEVGNRQVLQLGRKCMGDVMHSWFVYGTLAFKGCAVLFIRSMQRTLRLWWSFVKLKLYLFMCLRFTSCLGTSNYSILNSTTAVMQYRISGLPVLHLRKYMDVYLDCDYAECPWHASLMQPEQDEESQICQNKDLQDQTWWHVMRQWLVRFSLVVFVLKMELMNVF